MATTLDQFLQRTSRHATRWGRTMLGEWQRATGARLSAIGTHRQAVEQWKQELRNAPAPKGRVLITALRNRTWIGAGVYIACALRQKGYESTILFRGSDIARFFPNRHPRFGFWPGVAGIPGIRLIDLDGVAVSPAQRVEFESFAQAAAPSVLAYDRHVEEHDVLSDQGGLRAALPQVVDLLARMGAITKQVLNAQAYHRFIVYSGLIGESPSMLECARRLGVHTVCLEGWGWRPGHMLYNHNAPALDYDIQRWLRRIQPWDRTKEDEIARYLGFLDGNYKGGSGWLDNFYLIQRARISKELPPHVARFVEGDARVFLLAANVIGDSSMLRRETIFRGQQEWCGRVIEYFRARPHLKLIIRAHPGEVWFGAKAPIKMGEVARRLAHGVPNVLVIDGAEKLNTFTLLPWVQAGLVWLSSIGVDLVVRGVPVLAAASPKYSGLGIVSEPASPEEYFRLLEAWSGARPAITESQIQAAKEYLYIVFKGFSYEAWGRDFLATSARLGSPRNPEEHDAFFRALVEEAPDAA